MPQEWSTRCGVNKEAERGVCLGVFLKLNEFEDKFGF